MQRDVNDLQTALGQLKAQLAAADAQAYVERAERSGDRAFVGAVVREANGEALRHLEQRDPQPPAERRHRAWRESTTAASACSSARATTSCKRGVHAGNLVKLAAPLVGGKGGGQAAQAQGGGKMPAVREAAVRAIRDAVLA